VLGGYGFGTHPHDNMEIVSIPLKGAIKHRDSIGTEGVIKTGDIQIMSAGFGIEHSEYNDSKTDELKFLQIWIFPKEKDISPRYDQLTYDQGKMKNNLLEVISPEKKEDALWINQDAHFYLSDLSKEKNITYKINNSGNGVFVFALEGAIDVSGTKLQRRDAIGVYDTSDFEVTAKDDSQILFIEVPMN
jgi:quercetin 2,3-dioxygenase